MLRANLLLFTACAVPIIFITAHEDDAQRTQALEAGAVAVSHKPFYEEELLNAINAALKDS